MEKKFILTDKTMKFEGRTLYRIKALRSFSDVKAGDLGGWVQSEDNLSQEGDCWIYDEAKAMDSSKVCDNATMHWVSAMHNDARMFDNAILYDNSEIFNNGAIYGNAKMFDNSAIYGNGAVFDNVETYDNGRVCDNGEMRGNAILKENEVLRGMLTCRVDDFIEIPNPQGRLVTGMLINGDIVYNIGCQRMITKEEFINRIYNRDDGLEANPHRKRYLKIIDMIENYLKD